MITNEQLDYMLKVAGEATQGPWGELGSVELEVSCMSHCYGGTAHIYLGDKKTSCHADLEHIATFDPPTVTALIKELKAAREVVDASRFIVKRHTCHMNTDCFPCIYDRALEDYEEVTCATADQK